jgi:ribosome-associated protein
MVVKRAKNSRRSSPIASKVKAEAKAKPKSAGKSVAKTPRRAVAKKTAQLARSSSSAKSKPSSVVKVVEGALDEMKAVNVRVLDVHKLTDITDTMIIATGNSDRHVRSIADRIVEYAKKAGFRPMGIEGERDGEWVLVDLQDVIVHVMLPRVREFYRLESLWDVSAARREAAAAG